MRIQYNQFDIKKVELIRSTFIRIKNLSETATTLGINYMTAQKYTADLRPGKKKKGESPKPPIKLDQSDMQKGHVKLQKGETILPTRIPKAQRSVPMYDNKNTIKFVDLDDPRSNEEIRSAWKEEQEKKLRSLAS